MKSIDMHAHLVPRSLWRAVEAKHEWYGFRHEPGDGLGHDSCPDHDAVDHAARHRRLGCRATGGRANRAGH